MKITKLELFKVPPRWLFFSKSKRMKAFRVGVNRLSKGKRIRLPLP